MSAAMKYQRTKKMKSKKTTLKSASKKQKKEPTPLWTYNSENLLVKELSGGPDTHCPDFLLRNDARAKDVFYDMKKRCTKAAFDLHNALVDMQAMMPELVDTCFLQCVDPLDAYHAQDVEDELLELRVKVNKLLKKVERL